MKKIYLLLLAATLSLAPLSAQGLGDPWWGIKGGVNFSNLSSPNYSTQFLTGFNVGVAYYHPISSYMPLFVESGLYFERQGARDNGFLIDQAQNSKLISYELELPISIGYRTPLSPRVSVQSTVGLYYSVALNGTFQLDSGEFDPFCSAMIQTLRDAAPTEQRLLSRSDFGVRVGVSVLLDDYLLGFTFDGGLLNRYSRSLRDAGYQALSGCFSILLGYNF